MNKLSEPEQGSRDLLYWGSQTGEAEAAAKNSLLYCGGLDGWTTAAIRNFLNSFPDFIP